MSTDLSVLYRDMELRLIDSMTRNLALHLAEEAETGLEYPQWQAVKIRELHRYTAENKKIIRRKTTKLPEDIEKQLRSELKQSYELEMVKFSNALGTEKFLQAVAMNESFFKINTRKIDALIEELNGSLLKANHAALRMADDVYREVIFKFTFELANGVTTVDKAYDMAVKDFLSRGLNCISYRDGRQVNIADYADMALKTANKRAMLIGEGEARKQMKRHLVRITRHETSCRLCQPFQNKVLIDDVYSGGTRADGDYMLMSTAMELGLFHPRCQHGLDTYFPELDDTEEKYSPERKKIKKDDYGEHNRAHAENMVQKYKRLVRGSISKDNIRVYRQKLHGWEKILKELDTNE